MLGHHDVRVLAIRNLSVFSTSSLLWTEPFMFTWMAKAGTTT